MQPAAAQSSTNFHEQLMQVSGTLPCGHDDHRKCYRKPEQVREDSHQGLEFDSTPHIRQDNAYHNDDGY
jgi:hypothetical protein